MPYSNQQSGNGRPRLQLLITLVVGLLLTIFVTYLALDLARDRARANFEADAALLVEKFNDELNQFRNAGEDIRAFARASGGINRSIFYSFVSNSRSLSDKQFIAYILKRTHPAEGSPGWIFVSMSMLGKGSDLDELVSRDALANRIGAQIDQGPGPDQSISIQPGLGLEQLGLAEGMAIYLPVMPSRDKTGYEYVLLFETYQELYRKTLKSARQIMLNFVLYDSVTGDRLFGADPFGNELISTQIDAEQSPFAYFSQLVFANRSFNFTLTPLDGQYLTDYSVAIGLAALSLSMTLLVVYILYTQGQRAERVTEIVQRRTRALKQAHDELEEQYRLLQQMNMDLDDARTHAETANAAKSEFLATVSHELRTPMNAILGFSEILLSQALGPLGDDRYQDYARDINDSGQHLLSLINDILDLAKLEAGKVRLEYAPLSPEILAERVNSLLFQAARKKGLQLSYEVDDQLPDVLMGDELRLRQILINLVNNAIKYTQIGRITFRLRQEPMAGGRLGWVIEVEDTGVGIPDDKLDTLFDRFTQVEGTKVRQQGGAGLGLSICRELTEMMQGLVSVESEVDKGSIFRVHLPLDTVGDSDIDDDDGDFI